MTASLRALRDRMVIGLMVVLALGGAWPAGAAPIVVPEAPPVSSRAYLLEDFHTGRVLAERNADERMEPASLTKILATYVIFNEINEGKLRLDDEVVISEKAWRMSGSRMFVDVGSRVRVDDLLRGVIVQSGNDASVALAEHIAGSEEAFASLMNQHARTLGMTGSNFVNAEGMPHPDHYTTARDMARVTRALIRRFPELYRWHAQKEFTYNAITQVNRNRLLWRDESVDGVKTGYTKSAGYCLVSSAQRGDMRLISVVLGSDSANRRNQESESLLTYGFRFFETHRVFAANEPIRSTRVWEGEIASLGVGLADDLYVTVPRGAYDQVKSEVQLVDRAVAPIRQGEPRGILRVRLGEEPLESRNLIALQSVAEGSLWQKLSDKVRLLLFE